MAITGMEAPIRPIDSRLQAVGRYEMENTRSYSFTSAASSSHAERQLGVRSL
jgi:hypothetical protein